MDTFGLNDFEKVVCFLIVRRNVICLFSNEYFYEEDVYFKIYYFYFVFAYIYIVSDGINWEISRKVKSYTHRNRFFVYLNKIYFQYYQIFLLRAIKTFSSERNNVTTID